MEKKGKCNNTSIANDPMLDLSLNIRTTSKVVKAAKVSTSSKKKSAASLTGGVYYDNKNTKQQQQLQYTSVDEVASVGDGSTGSGSTISTTTTTTTMGDAVAASGDVCTLVECMERFVLMIQSFVPLLLLEGASQVFGH